MKENIYERIKNHKPKHNLKFDFNIEDLFKDGDLSLHFTIFDKHFNNRSIALYSFDEVETRKNKMYKILKMLNNKRKALEFISRNK